MDDLRAAGVDAVALPLIAINGLDDSAPLLRAVRHLADYDALMFVSAPAVAYFFRAAGERRVVARCWATGPGTVRALREAGVAEAAIDAPPADATQFDSEALWARVRPQVKPGTRVLIVRGADAAGQVAGRDWLAHEIAAAGGRCDNVAAYRRLPATFGDAERLLATRAAADGTIWLFSSSEALACLRASMPGADWHAACALATHPRIADAARAAGFGRVRVCRADLPAMIASIESFA